MNLGLSEEQELLRDAARGALARVDTLGSARRALDGAERLDLWDVARRAGWPGLLIDERHGGAGCSAFDAMLVLGECGRVLASTPLLGQLPATALLQAADDEPTLAAAATGALRWTWLPARPPGGTHAGWTVEGDGPLARGAAPRARRDGARVRFDGVVRHALDATAADVLVVVGVADDGAPVAGVVEAAAVELERARPYDATRDLADVRLAGVDGRALAVGPDAIARAWHLAQALLAAESLGAAQAALAVTVAYARERQAFGRTIGSFQAVKHALTEVLRRNENGDALLLHAGWAYDEAPDELALAAAAARAGCGAALDLAARQGIATHGGIGATWEHDLPLYFRRAQLSRRLLGGVDDALDRVAAVLLSR